LEGKKEDMSRRFGQQSSRSQEPSEHKMGTVGEPLKDSSFSVLDSLSSRATIVVSNLSIVASSGKRIAEDLSLSVSTGERLAIIGPEGAGKSTLIECLAGIRRDNFAYSGQVAVLGTSGYLPQELSSSWDALSLMEFLFQSTPGEHFDVDNWNNLADVRKCLQAVGLDADALEMSVATLSGGEKVRAQLAKVLLNKPSFLLMDEPTNNLDIETIKWLERFIVKSQVPVLFVSHDETLIRNTATGILYMTHRSYDNRAFSYHSGEGYDDFLGRLEQAVDRAEKDKSGLKREIKKLTIRQAEFNNKLSGAANFQKGAGAAEKSGMRRAAAKASSRGGAMEKKLDDLKDKVANFDIPHYERDGHIDFPNACSVPRGKQILSLSGIPITVADKVLVREIELNISGPEKVGIIGSNGIGKSTLLKMVRSMHHFEGVRLGYMPQNFREILSNPKLSALEFLKEHGETETSARIYLTRMGFAQDEVHNSIESLSGGQRGKLIILLTAISHANFLILDEPTRNLSPLTAPVLRHELSSFPGAILVVSHDRMFLSEVCSRVLELTKQGLRPVDIKTLRQAN